MQQLSNKHSHSVVIFVTTSHQIYISLLESGKGRKNFINVGIGFHVLKRIILIYTSFQKDYNLQLQAIEPDVRSRRTAININKLMAR